MALVMDGVRRSCVGAQIGVSAMVMPMPLAAPSRVRRAPMKRISAATSKANYGVRYVTGMDGIRRPVALTPRDMLRNMTDQTPAVTASAVAAAAMTTETGPWRLPSLRLPEIGWKRPAMAFGLVAVALVASGLTVHALATPHTTTARAETRAAEKPVAPAPSIAPAAAAAPAVAAAPKNANLQKILDDFVAGNTDKFGIVVKDLKTGETAAFNPDKQFASASLYKLFVAQRIYQRIDLGQLNYGQPAGGGTGRNIDGCLQIMINISDNACGRALGDILGWGSQDQALGSEGYKQTDLSTPQQTSAGDVSKLFERLYDGTLVSANSGQRFLDLLKDQRVNNRLPQGLPGGTVIAHKTGDLDGVVHDAGIVYGPKTDYLVVVTSGPWSAPGNTPGMFADLSGKLWNYFEQ